MSSETLPTCDAIDIARIHRRSGVLPPFAALGRRGRFEGGTDGRLFTLDLHSPHVLRSLEGVDTGGGDIGHVRALYNRALAVGVRGLCLQFNPISDLGWNDCPYQADSPVSYDASYAHLEGLGSLLDCEAFRELQKRQAEWYATQDRSRFSHQAQRGYKRNALRIAYKRMRTERQFGGERERFGEFRDACEPHVREYAVFSALKDETAKDKSRTDRPWWEWDADHRHGCVEEILKLHRGDPDFRALLDFAFYTQHVMQRQWGELAAHIQSTGGQIILDHAYAPKHDSAIVWAHQHLYHLRPDGTLRYASGWNDDKDKKKECEQFWGGAVNRFDGDNGVSEQVIELQLAIIQWMAKISKIIRLDHFPAYGSQYYLIDMDDRAGSHFAPALKHRLLQRFVQECPDVHFIAEDAGGSDDVYEEMRAVREAHGMSGLFVPQWGPYCAGGKHADVRRHPALGISVSDTHDTDNPHVWWYHLFEQFRTHFRCLMGSDWSTYDFTRLMSESPAHLAGVSERFWIGDHRKYNEMGTVRDTNWSARNGVDLESIDFQPLAGILEQTGRGARRLLGKDPVLGASPGPGEHRHCRPGGKVSLQAALQPGTVPRAFRIFTNAPVLGRNAGDWAPIDFPVGDELVTVSRCGDETLLFRVTIPLSQEIAPGRYELAASVAVNGREHPLCLPGQNIELVVE